MAGNRWASAKATNPAEIYNQKRRIIFSQMQKDPAVAKTWLEGYQQTLGKTGYVGLKAEVAFFEQHQRDYDLVVAADVGDATDFVGFIDGALHRIDVTTNTNFKHLKSYEPLQLEGARYEVASAYRSQLLRAVEGFDPCVDAGLTGLAAPNQIAAPLRQAITAINELARAADS